MNKAQLNELLKKIKREEQADRLIEGIRVGYYVAIAVGNSEIKIENENHLNTIKKILTEISEEGNQALEKARLE